MDNHRHKGAIMQATPKFCDRVRKVWGGNPRRVAYTAFVELFCHEGEIKTDFDSLIEYGLQIDELVDELKYTTPDEFITAFTEQVLNANEA